MEVDDLDYEGWRAVLSKLDHREGGSNSPTQGQSTPSFTFESMDSPSSGFNAAQTSPDSPRYKNSNDLQWGTWPTLPDSGMHAGDDLSQSYRLADLDGFGESIAFSKTVPQQPQYASPLGFSPSETEIQVNASVNPAALSVVETTVEPFLNGGYYEFGGSIPSSVPSVQQIYQNVDASPLGFQRQPLPPSDGIGSQPISWQSYQQAHAIAYPRSPQDTASLSPEPVPRSDIKKRKLTSDDEPSPDRKGQRGAKEKKSSHNVIEKRYRRNLNEKITILRDSVPSLRALTRGSQGGDVDSGDPDSMATAHKLNKATILSKATEYIKQLESHNKQLAQQCDAQRARIEAFKKLDAAGRMGNSMNAMGYQNQFSDIGLGDDKGMVQPPEAMLFQQRQRQLARKQPGQPDFTPGRPPPRLQQGGNRKVSGGALTKLMVGSMAGVMVLEGFSEREHGGKTPAGRGLFAPPLEAIKELRRLLTGTGGHVFASVDGNPLTPDLLLLLVKMTLIIGAIVYVLSPSFFDLAPKGKKKAAPALSATATPTSAVSPVEVRRKAWLTAIQTIRFPRRSFMEDPITLIMTAMRHCLRHLIGPHAYARLTGTTKEQELARVKAWDVALDAQLAGGDADISKTRLGLTLMASTTLPDTPARLMLRALHVRVLLMDSGYGLERLSAKLARRYWNEARTLQKLATGGGTQESSVMVPSTTATTTATTPEGLPAHLAALLEMECQDVMPDSILRRVHNLTRGRPTSEGFRGIDEGMDAVADDFSIRTPLDALAAWWSSFALHQGLIGYLEAGDDARGESHEVTARIRDAIRVAPPTSGAQLRALVAKAALGPPGSSKASLSAALDALPHCEIYRVQQSSLVSNPAASVVTTSGIRVAVRCAMSLVSLHGAAPQGAAKFFNELALDKPGAYLGTRIGLLGFVAAWKALDVFSRDEELVKETRVGLEGVALELRLWIGGERGRRCGLGRKMRGVVVERCLKVCKDSLGMGEDEVGVPGGGAGAGT